MPTRVGDITAASADDEDLHLVGAVTGLTRATVVRRCRDAHGNMLLRNVFDDRWPSEADGLEDCTVALARDAGLDFEIANVTGLSERTVVRRLHDERGNMLVGTAFPELYHDEDEEDEDDVDDTDHTKLVDLAEVDLLGATHVVSARSVAMASWLASQLGWTPLKMRGLLRRTHGRTLLRNVFVDEWPIQMGAGSRAMLGQMRSATVARSAPLVAWVARILGKGFEHVARELTYAEGNMLVQNVLAPWPEDVDDRASPRPVPSPVPADSRRESPAPPIRGPARNQTSGIGPGMLVKSRWRILREIGDVGGFGEVFEVKDENRPDRDGFVMKIAGGATAAERRAKEDHLRNEVKIAHGLTHQNICAYLDDGLDQDLDAYFAIMKHAGDSLEQLIAAGNMFSVADALDIGQQVAAGLDYAHRRGVVHHDVKPANVMVRTEAGNRDVRIGDWGISRYGRGTLRSDGSPTVIATVVGYSRGYRAPEQWRGEARAASDQYCLALIVCSMLEGRVFTDHYRWGGLRALTAGQNLVMGRALSPEPEDRFKTCPDFVGKLQGA